MSRTPSRKVAAIAFTANLVLCGLIGTGLLLLRGPSDPADAVPEPSTSTPTSPTPSTPSESKPTEPSAPGSSPTDTSEPPGTPTSTPSPGFRDVYGPGGIVTKVPAGWPAKARKTDTQATDPTQPTSFLRYGGSASPAQPLITVMRTQERSFSKQYPGYQLIALRPAIWRQHEAVTWTFEFDTTAGRKHVDSVYWRAGLNDYVVYASALLENWPAMQQIYTTARDAAQP